MVWDRTAASITGWTSDARRVAPIVMRGMLWIRSSAIPEKSESSCAVWAGMRVGVGCGLCQDASEGLDDGPVFVGPVAARHPHGVEEGRCDGRVRRDQTILAGCQRLRQDGFQTSAGVAAARFDGGGDRVPTGRPSSVTKVPTMLGARVWPQADTGSRNGAFG
jgi:hypothetical protein